MLSLDKYDIKLLELLQEDSSRSTAEIAEQLNLSQSPCWRRIQRLQQAGVITKQLSVINREQLGLDLVAFATINLSSVGRKNMERLEEAVSQLDEVVECYTMTGAWDYMLKIVVKDIRHYERFVRTHLLELPVIGEIHSHIAVTEIKNTTALPLKTQLDSSS